MSCFEGMCEEKEGAKGWGWVRERGGSDYLALLVLLPCSASSGETEVSFVLKMSMQIPWASPS